MEKFLAGLKSLLKARTRAQSELAAGAEMMLDAVAEHQKEFQKTKQQVEDDIKRGARYTRTKLPL